ncbi:unnamed protein product [Brassica napus]|uniref:WAT1-related protein n=1 Tax=Brassica napus TaxID=3708 RepID=A0A816V4T4_BRANA|nr:unnamed protein product [Brassica napus]
MNVVEGERSSIVDKWAPAMAVVVANTVTGSVNALVKKALDGGVNHMVIGAYRLAISAFILAPLAYFLERKTRPKITLRLLIDHFISGLIGFAPLFNYFHFPKPTKHTSAKSFICLLRTITSINNTASRIPTLLMESVRDLKSETGMLKVMGTLICVGGALLLTFYKGPQISHFHSHPEALQDNNNHQSKTNNWLLGCLYAAIGASFFSMWMLFQGTLNIKYPCKYTSICLMSVFGSFQCALLSLYKRRTVNDWVIDDRFVIFVIAYAGIVGQAMSTVATTWSIKKLGAVFASTFSPIMLISATLFDFLILHTPLCLGSIIGSVVVVTGLYVYLWGKNKEMKAAATMCPPIQNEDKYNTNDNNTNNNGSRLSV